MSPSTQGPTHISPRMTTSKINIYCDGDWRVYSCQTLRGWQSGRACQRAGRALRPLLWVTFDCYGMWVIFGNSAFRSRNKQDDSLYVSQNWQFWNVIHSRELSNMSHIRRLSFLITWTYTFQNETLIYKNLCQFRNLFILDWRKTMSNDIIEYKNMLLKSLKKCSEPWKWSKLAMPNPIIEWLFTSRRFMFSWYSHGTASHNSAMGSHVFFPYNVST